MFQLICLNFTYSILHCDVDLKASGEDRGPPTDDDTHLHQVQALHAVLHFLYELYFLSRL